MDSLLVENPRHRGGAIQGDDAWGGGKKKRRRRLLSNSGEGEEGKRANLVFLGLDLGHRKNQSKKTKTRKGKGYVL